MWKMIICRHYLLFLDAPVGNIKKKKKKKEEEKEEEEEEDNPFCAYVSVRGDEDIVVSVGPAIS